MKVAFDTLLTAKDNGQELSDEYINGILTALGCDRETINQKDRFFRGYAIEALFHKIYGQLPWVKIITPLEQEQFPKNTKKEFQVPDYMINYEVGDSKHCDNVLIDVKAVSGDKKTLEISKKTVAGLKNYAATQKMPLLIAVFWRQALCWTVNDLASFTVKSSSYKMNREKAIASDLSSILGDYTYVFRHRPFRRTLLTTDENVETSYGFEMEKYGRAIRDELSLDGKTYKSLLPLATPVVDFAFDFVATDKPRYIDDVTTELNEQMADKTYCIKLTTLMLGYLAKIYLYKREEKYDYLRPSDVTESAFHIVDTVRRDMGGEIFYIVPKSKAASVRDLFLKQFGRATQIAKALDERIPSGAQLLLAPHVTA